jgi:hypothetical protein
MTLGLYSNTSGSFNLQMGSISHKSYFVLGWKGLPGTNTEAFGVHL